jgi:hypothetical protein
MPGGTVCFEAPIGLSLRDSWTACVWRPPNSDAPEGEDVLSDFLIPVSGTIHFVICSFGRQVNDAKHSLARSAWESVLERTFP